MLHRLPTLPGLPSVGLPPDALPLVAQPTTFTKTITSRGASYQKTLCPKAEEVSPRQVSDQKILYYLVEEASPAQFSWQSQLRQ